MVLTTLSLLPLCAFISCGIVSGAVFLARSPVYHARFLLWLLHRRRHQLLSRMLLRLLRMQLRLLMMLRFMLMTSRSWPMRRLFPLTMRLHVLALGGLAMMAMLLLFSFPVFHGQLA